MLAMPNEAAIVLGSRRVSHQHHRRTAEFDEELQDEEFEDEVPRSRFWVSALVCVVLAATGSGAAFAWHGYGGDALAFAATPKAASAPQTAAAQDAVLKSLADAQQRQTAIAQQNQQLLQAQAAEMKRLSDTVAQLASRVEALSGRNAQAFAPPPAPKKPPAPKIVEHKPAAPAPISLAPEEKK
jgi:hypothetical protein